MLVGSSTTETVPAVPVIQPATSPLPLPVAALPPPPPTELDAYVKHQGKPTCLKVFLSDTVLAVKQKIQEAEGFRPDLQILSYTGAIGGPVLQNDHATLQNR